MSCYKSYRSGGFFSDRGPSPRPSATLFPLEYAMLWLVAFGWWAREAPWRSDDTRFGVTGIRCSPGLPVQTPSRSQLSRLELERLKAELQPPFVPHSR